MKSTTPAYGTTRRRRPALSYGEIERAANAILKGGERPTVENLREALGGGSPKSILDALRRYWREIGTRLDRDPPALKRLPAEVADVAAGLWIRALDLAAEAHAGTDTAAQERMAALQRENELRGHAISIREKELDGLLRARERTVHELETHLATAMTFVAKAQSDIKSLETRLAQSQAESDAHRNRLARVVARAVLRNRKAPRPVLARATRITNRRNRKASKRRPPAKRARPIPNRKKKRSYGRR